MPVIASSNALPAACFVALTDIAPDSMLGETGAMNPQPARPCLAPGPDRRATERLMRTAGIDGDSGGQASHGGRIAPEVAILVLERVPEEYVANPMAAASH